MEESEFYATVTGTAEELGMPSWLSDLGLMAEVRTWTDSSDSVEKGLEEGKAHRAEILVSPRDDPFGKSEIQKSAQRVQFGGSLDDREGLA